MNKMERARTSEEIRELRVRLAEANRLLRRCLDMVESDAGPPNWDMIRDFLNNQ